MKDYAKPQDVLLVEALAEHDEFVARVPQYEWYEPIVTTRRDRIVIGAGSRVDSFCKLEGGEGLHIGRNVHIASFSHLNIGGGALTIGDGAAFASGCKVISGGNTLEGVSMSATAPQDEQVRVQNRVTIGRNAALLTNAVLIGGSMGEGSVLAAGAVCVHKHVPDWEVWAGVPARRVALRIPPPPDGTTMSVVRMDGRQVAASVNRWTGQ